MEPQPQENFFELTLSQEGSARMMRLYRIVKWLFAISILTSLSFMTVTYLRTMWYSRFLKDVDYMVRLELTVFPIYSIIWNVFFISQLISYFIFSRKCKRAIELHQADLFNHSFKWLLRSALLSIAIIVLELAWEVFAIYESIYLLEKYPATSWIFIYISSQN